MFGFPFRLLELGGGVVEAAAGRLILPPITTGYADAQVDDYGRYPSRAQYPWQPGCSMRLQARFSHNADELLGTAGFGFWNAPFGDPTIRFPTLPQAAWFFFASPPNDLPLAPIDQPGRGWFAATLDGATPQALLLLPLAPAFLLLNQFPRLRRWLWPFVRQRLNISFASLSVPMTAWHTYDLRWRPERCTFRVDDAIILDTPCSPHGPLGFVGWIDNQYLIAKANGRFSWGTLPIAQTQWLEIAEFSLQTLPETG